jgi:hypothetical protein
MNYMLVLLATSGDYRNSKSTFIFEGKDLKVD